MESIKKANQMRAYGMKVLPILAIFPLLATGCNRSDGDKLARVGWTVAGKVQALIPDRTPLAAALPGKPQGLEERVRERFKSDKYLAPVPIEVIAENGSVRLRGQVDDEILKRRAVEIAESTVGVEKVVDEIDVVRR